MAELEGLGHLLALTAGALLALRVVAWGLFFLVLDGYVPSLVANGVMCAYGVVQSRPELAHVVLWAKPAGVGCLLIWWSLAAAEREVAGAPFLGLRFLTIAPLAAIVALEVAAEVNWLFADKLTPAVTCCSAALDSTRTLNGFRTTAFLGLSGAAILAILFASKLLLIGVCGFIAHMRPTLRFGWTSSVCLASTAIAFFDLIAWRDAVAPRALGLEFHRCAYELVTRSIALGPTALLTTLAHLGLFALPVLALVRRQEVSGTARAVHAIARFAALLLATELLVLGLQLF